MTKQVKLPVAIKKVLEVLRLFNRKVDKLGQFGFWKRYQDEVPNAIVKMEEPRFEKVDDRGRFSIIARVHSWLEDFNQDEIDAFVLN
jgi:hypothetical protein